MKIEEKRKSIMADKANTNNTSKMNRHSDWSLLVLRLITGIGFMVHGWAKLSHGTGGFEKLLMQLSIPFAHPMSSILPYIELLGGIAILAGLLTRILSGILIGTMLVAMFTIHIHYGFSSIKTIGLTADGPVFGPPGYEINLLYIAILICLIVNGAGRLSVDGILAGHRGRKQ